jgi:hypothetical protein
VEVAIMSDDRDLVGRLAAIDATPRASWVAELRADLDAAWGTGDAGYLDSLRPTTLTLVAHEPTPSQPSSGRRWLILIATAAAVVAAFALVATREDQATPADQPTPTVTVTQRAMPNTSRDQLAPGTYFVDEVEGTPTPRIFFTIGAGWFDPYEDEGWAILNQNVGVVAFSRPARVFSEFCRPDDGFHPGPVDTVDGLVAALSEQGGWADVSAVSEISLDGYSGKAFRRTAPTEFADCETGLGGTRLSAGPVSHPVFGSWEGGAGGGPYEPGETETLWVLDIDGTVVLIDAGVWPGPSSAARADAVAAVLNSIRIDRSSSPEAAASEPAASTPPILPIGGREWGVGAVVPDLGQFTDQATLIDALIASGPLENQLLSDGNLRPGVSICADIVRYHEPTVGTLVHEANAVLNGQGGVVLVFMQPRGGKEVHMYGTDDVDPMYGGCLLLLREPLQPGPATNPLLPD